MADIERSIKLGIDTGDSLATLGKLKKELANLYVDLESAEKGTAAFKKLDAQIKNTEKSVKKAEAAFGDASDKIKTLSGSGVEKATASFGLLKEGITGLDFGKFKTGLTGITGSFRALGGAIAATGIGAIVIAVTLLIQNFDKLAASGGIVGKVFQFIGDYVNFVITTLENLADKLGLIDLEEQKNSAARAERSKKFIEDEQNKVKEVGDRYDKEIKLAKSLGKETDDLELKQLKAQKAVIDNQIERIKAFQQATTLFDSVLKPLLDKLTKDQEQAALDVQIKQNEIQTKGNEKYKKNLEERAEFEKRFIQRNALEKINDEEKAAIEEAKRLGVYEENRLNIQRAFSIKRAELANKEAADDDRIIKERKAKEDKAAQDATKAAEDAKVKREKGFAEKKALEDKALADEQENVKKRLEAEKRLQDAKIGAVSDGLATISSLTELFTGKSKEQQRKAFNIQKGVSIAQAGIATFESATKAFNSLAGIPVVGPVLGGIAAAAAVAAGLANIKKIASQKFDGGGDNTPAPTTSSNLGGGSSAAGGGGFIAPPTFNLGGQQIGGASNMLGGGFGGTTQQPIRVYVSETDITNTQNKVSVIQGNSLFGSGG